MNINIGINQADRLEIANGLNRLLADTYTNGKRVVEELNHFCSSVSVFCSHCLWSWATKFVSGGYLVHATLRPSD